MGYLLSVLPSLSFPGGLYRDARALRTLQDNIGAPKLCQPTHYARFLLPFPTALACPKALSSLEGPTSAVTRPCFTRPVRDTGRLPDVAECARGLRSTVFPIDTRYRSLLLSAIVDTFAAAQIDTTFDKALLTVLADPEALLSGRVLYGPPSNWGRWEERHLAISHPTSLCAC